MTQSWVRRASKRTVNSVCLLILALPALTCWLGLALGDDRDPVFVFWTHVCALLPGLPGVLLRRAFYRWTLAACAEDVTIEFGAVMTRRKAILENGVYIGAYALIGWAWIREHTLVGSRVSMLSGGQQHQLSPNGRWTPTTPSSLTRIVVGPNAWIGEGAILMADVGHGCMVAAGAVVSAAIPAGVMVAGNPARFVRRVTAEPVHEGTNDVAAPAVR